MNWKTSYPCQRPVVVRTARSDHFSGLTLCHDRKPTSGKSQQEGDQRTFADGEGFRLDLPPSDRRGSATFFHDSRKNLRHPNQGSAPTQPPQSRHRDSRHKLVVVTGPSGSGKSSLAFDTLFAEGQRRYVESLSAYARQFLDQNAKARCGLHRGTFSSDRDRAAHFDGKPALDHRHDNRNLRLPPTLFAAVGVPHDPKTGERVARQTPQEISDAILRWPAGTKFLILAPLVSGQVGEFRDVIEKARREGFVRLRIDDEVVDLGEQKPSGWRKRNPIGSKPWWTAWWRGPISANALQTRWRPPCAELAQTRDLPHGARHTDWTEEKFSTISAIPRPTLRCLA